MYGYLEKYQIDDLYDKCNFAVDSLGWHRSGVKIGTSIKTREYLAKGLPILASTPIDMFPSGWEYAFYAPIDDSPICVKDIVKFYLEKIKGNKLNDLIRSIAFEKCDMKSMMLPIIKELLNGYNC